MFKKLLRDPLTLFFVLGLLIFIGQAYLDSDDDYSIAVQPADIQRLTDQWSMQMRRPPSAQELEGLLEQFVKEEIYYREAQRLNLDSNDTIVRRRMVQKLTFLTEDIATASPPTEEELQKYYDEHVDDYAIPVRMSFKHRYFSSDRRETAEADAEAALADETTSGDPFMLQREYASRSQREIGDLFGRAFANELFALNTSDVWQGPIQSAYGWHTILLSSREESRLPELAEVRDRVIADAKQAARQQANDDYYQQLQATYEITYPTQPAITPSS